MTNCWSRAKALAEQTPNERNRYVDFLRAVSILVVITGHWLMVAVYYHARNADSGWFAVRIEKT